jgi:hypothetical protein
MHRTGTSPTLTYPRHPRRHPIGVMTRRAPGIRPLRPHTPPTARFRRRGRDSARIGATVVPRGRRQFRCGATDCASSSTRRPRSLGWRSDLPLILWARSTRLSPCIDHTLWLLREGGASQRRYSATPLKVKPTAKRNACGGQSPASCPVDVSEPSDGPSHATWISGTDHGPRPGELCDDSAPDVAESVACATPPDDDSLPFLVEMQRQLASSRASFQATAVVPDIASGVELVTCSHPRAVAIREMPLGPLSWRPGAGASTRAGRRIVALGQYVFPLGSVERAAGHGAGVARPRGRAHVPAIGASSVGDGE